MATRTNLYTLLCICVRLCAVYLFAETLIWTIDQVYVTRREVSSTIWLYTLSEPALGIVLAALLWMFPGPLVRIAGDRRTLENFESDITPQTLQYIALAVLGFWFAITGICQVVYTLHRWLFLGLYISRQLPDPTTDPKVYGLLLSEVVKTLLGVTLALRAHGIAKALTQTSHAGLPPVQSDAAIERPQEKP